MNTSALAIAAAATAGVILSIKLDRLAKNKYLGLLLRVIGILVSLSLIVILPSDDQTTYKTGEYYAMLVIPALIIMSIINKRKKT